MCACPPLTGAELAFTRYTEPDANLKRLLAHMKLSLPTQPAPKIRIPPTEQAPAAMPL